MIIFYFYSSNYRFVLPDRILKVTAPETGGFVGDLFVLSQTDKLNLYQNECMKITSMWTTLPPDVTFPLNC
jgi:hypothetical protein